MVLVAVFAVADMGRGFSRFECEMNVLLQLDFERFLFNDGRKDGLQERTTLLYRSIENILAFRTYE